MRATFIGHASLLVEAGGISILSDPWWRGPCFGAQWWIWPAPALQEIRDRNIDYVYISHGHHDHLHPGTLTTLGEPKKYIVAEGLGLGESLRNAAGGEILEVAPDKPIDLGSGVQVGIWPTHGGDSLMWVKHGETVLVNANDALHSAPRDVQDFYIKQLRDLLGHVDYFFCGYATASHFPNCYVIPGVDRIATARKRQRHFTDSWVRLVEELRPTYAFPFAGDVAFFEQDLFWLNDALQNDSYLSLALEELTSRSGGTTTCHRIAPGFTITHGGIESCPARPAFDEKVVQRVFEDEIRRANRYGVVSDSQIEEAAKLLRRNLSVAPNWFGSFPRDYDYVITFREGTGALLIAKRGKDVSVSVCKQPPAAELTVMVRLSYLRYALQTEYGHEILFVGSGVRFSYDSIASARSRLHLEAMAALRPQVTDRPRPEYSVRGHVKRLLKGAVGKLTGQKGELDLYDLETWLVQG